MRAVGLAGSFYVNAASFFAVIWAVYALRLPPAPPRQGEERVGGFLLAHFSSIRHKGRLAVGGGIGFCAALIAFCFTGWLPGAVALLFVVGLFTTVFTSTVLTLLQQITSDQMRGRVMSLFTICMIGLSPLGALPLSWAADRFGVNRATVCSALIAGLYALAVALGCRPLLESMRLTEEEESGKT
ncbi:MAG TPA: hypothetical protein VFA07_02260 [Chthonomonadaceae bacterium]|nr:hypothetical protein [Chthonomonadaceae bacterium]